MATMDMKISSSEPLKPPDWDADEFEIPPFLRAPEKDTRLATVNMIEGIDAKIAKLAKLGLRPHPNMVGYWKELVEQLESGGPYRLRVTSGVF
ncbi:MAG: hypothetical protein HHJ17_06605 [Rhodoferax sp.]|uniref:hypothetical protein n=1 Tax=Rhodoferax sp. TaxID=50421 RepID=UPI0017C97C34|nr:hypothetical protein [Rhodoferax sp.]NMM13194.1 hypothetical protein [Rhodoferax sp.]